MLNNFYHLLIVFILLLTSSISSLQADSKSRIEPLDELLLKNNYQQICQKKTELLSTLFYSNNSQDPFFWRKGDISRIFFFCEAAHHIKLSRRQRRTFEIWDIKDPVSIKECTREKSNQEKRIENNYYVINRC